MLEFIVLGQVPGTGWQLNFVSVLFVMFTLYLLKRSLSAYYRYHKFVSRSGHSLLYIAVAGRSTKELNTLTPPRFLTQETLLARITRYSRKWTALCMASVKALAKRSLVKQQA